MAPAPRVISKPREEADEDSEAAASVVAPEAGSSACGGVGVMVKGLTGAGRSMKGPTVPRSKSKNELPPVSWTSKLKSREWEAFHVCGSAVEA